MPRPPRVDKADLVCGEEDPEKVSDHSFLKNKEGEREALDLDSLVDRMARSIVIK